MRSRGPLITLLVGLAMAGVLVTLSINANRTDKLAASAVNAPAAQAGGAVQPGKQGEQRGGDAPDNQPGGEDAEGEDAEGAEGAEDGGQDQDADKGDQDDDAAPAAPANNQKVTWAGRVKGGKATVAITANGGKAIAYVCDGDELEVWLSGSAVDGKLNLNAADDSDVQASLVGSFGNGRAKGTIDVGGEELAFDVGLVKKPSGLYRATAQVRGASLDGGWIVLNDGTQVGLATFAGSPIAVSPLDTATRTATVFGEKITATAVDPGARR